MIGNACGSPTAIFDLKRSGGKVDKGPMEISPLASSLSAGKFSDVAEQVALFALKKTLDTSQAQASAVLQLMEQVPTPQTGEHQIDVYA